MLEGSHKLKEISYIHSEAYPAGEMKHGANALLSKNFPVLVVMTQNQLYEKIKSNVEEVRARKSKIIIIATEGDKSAKELSDDIVYIPKTMELLEPLLNTIPLQLFAYHVAAALNRDVDRPRNLAKSVTVEWYFMKIIPQNNAPKFSLPLPIWSSVHLADAIAEEGGEFSAFVGLEKKYTD